MEQITNAEFGAYLKMLGNRMLVTGLSAKETLAVLPVPTLKVLLQQELNSELGRLTEIIEACRTTGDALVQPVINFYRSSIALIGVPPHLMETVHHKYDPKFDILFCGSSTSFCELERVSQGYDKIIVLESDSAFSQARVGLVQEVAGPRALVVKRGQSIDNLYKALDDLWETQSKIPVYLKPGEAKCGGCGAVFPIAENELDPERARCPECHTLNSKPRADGGLLK